jgi:Helix-turn-helix family
VIDDDAVRRKSRRLRDLVEPLAANVYFAPEAHQAYGELGLSFLPGYFCSRGACMGQVPGEVIASAFAVFNPALVLPAVEEGWSKTDAPTILAARQDGATASLQRLLDGVPEGVERATALLRRAGEAAPLEGYPLAAGLSSLGFPGDSLGDLWRAADIVREHRGDSHTGAWVSAGIGAVEITLLTELWWRLPLKSYAPTRGWDDAQLDAALDGLRARGLVDGDAFTPAGEALRAAVEESTDRQERRVVEALGDDADELLDLLEPWSKAVVASGGYPTDPAQLSRP